MGGIGIEEGRDSEGPNALNLATSPEEPHICLRSMQCAQGLSTVCESAKFKVLGINRELKAYFITYFTTRGEFYTTFWGHPVWSAVWRESSFIKYSDQRQVKS